jgi:hypothetical protein
MQPWKNTLLLASVLTAAMTTLPLRAEPTVACNALAPGLSEAQLTTGEGAYYNLTGEPLSAALAQQASELKKHLSGRWTGTFVRETCRGHFSNPVMHRQDFTLEAQGEVTHKGELRLEAEMDSRRIFKVQKLFLSSDVFAVEKRDDNTWTFVEKYRARGPFKGALQNEGLSAAETTRYGAQGLIDNPSLLAPSLTGHTGRLVHEVKTVRIDGDKSTVDHKTYVNGFLVSQDSWSLTRT